MWKKKDKPHSSEPGDPADPRDFAEHADEPAADFGDAGGPVGNVDPEEIVAHQERLQEVDRFREIEERLLADVEDWKSKYARSLADFQNYQRRAIENEKEARRQGITSVVQNLMGVLDTFDLALQQDASKGSAEQIMQGIRMIKQQFMHALSSVGVTPIEPRPGDEFDPHKHEAVAHIATPDVEPGTTFQTFQPGYALADRVLRPAKIAVAKQPD